MENDNKENIGTFLNTSESAELFAELDYLLKDGVHIQNYGDQVKYYGYIKSNEEQLSAYYKKLFKIDFSYGGVDSQKYYYLDFTTGKGGKIPEKNRHSLKSEFVIIGFIIYKIFYIDHDIDLNSVQKLKEKIRIDFEEYKQGIYRLIAKSKNINPGNVNDENVDISIQSALQEFKKIGWVTMEKDDFDLLPAFDRLISVYEKHIQNIDETLNELR